jgi:ketosteroid isomerase-like protein
MSDLTPVIETMENRWMRAWVNRDIKALKGMTSKDFIFLAASTPPAILDRPSWLEAVSKRYRCKSYRFDTIYVRDWGRAALFASSVELTATVDGEDWSRRIWLTDLWKKGRVQRGWKLAQRVMSRLDEDPQLAFTIKSLQLWK